MTLPALAQTRVAQLALRSQATGSPTSSEELGELARELGVKVPDLRAALAAQLGALEAGAAAAAGAGDRSAALRNALGTGAFRGQATANAATTPALRGHNLTVPPRPAATATSATFLTRPGVQDDNPTWRAMTESRGQAFDIRMEGRAVDGELLYELARYGKDEAVRGDVAELAGVGLIDAKAFQQITNNTNFAGWEGSLKERVGFALAVADGDGLLEKYWSSVSSDPSAREPGFSSLQRLWEVSGSSEPFAAWSGRVQERGASLLAAAKDRALLSSASAGEVFAARVAGGLPDALRGASAGQILGYQVALRGGATASEAISIAERVGAGELDAETLRLLTPSAESGSVTFSAHFGDSASLGAVDLRTATQVAGEVARGELSSGQLYGFFMKYGGADDHAQARFDVGEAAKMIKAVNRGEIDAARLDMVLDDRTHFPSKLTERVWKRMFSAATRSRGNKYTVSGAAPRSLVTAPLTRRLSATVVAQLAADDGKLNAFTAAFGARVEEHLPSARELRKRSDDESRWEVDVYAGVVETAFRMALRDIDLD